MPSSPIYGYIWDDRVIKSGKYIFISYIFQSFKELPCYLEFFKHFLSDLNAQYTDVFNCNVFVLCLVLKRKGDSRA